MRLAEVQLKKSWILAGGFLAQVFTCGLFPFELAFGRHVQPLLEGFSESFFQPGFELLLFCMGRDCNFFSVQRLIALARSFIMPVSQLHISKFN